MLHLHEHATSKGRVCLVLAHLLIRYAIQEPTDDVRRPREGAVAVRRERDIELGEDLFQALLEGFDGSGTGVGVPSYRRGAGC